MRNRYSPAIRDKAPLVKRRPPRSALLFIISVMMTLAATALTAARPQQTAPNKAESQDQPIRLKTDLMELRAVVTDKQGRLVTDLNKTDFEVLENGRGQVISFFSAEQIKSERAANLPGTSPATRRQVPTGNPKRTVAFFVDTLHMANASLIRVKQELLKFDSDEAKQDAARAVSQPNVRSGVNLFRRGDFISFYGKAHKAALGAQNATGLMLQGQVLQDEKVVLDDAWKPLSSFVLNKEADSVEFGGRIRAAGFKPGLYTLRVSVKDPQSKEVQTRETSFEIIP